MLNKFLNDKEFSIIIILFIIYFILKILFIPLIFKNSYKLFNEIEESHNEINNYIFIK